MAQFNYEAYAAQQSARRSAVNTGNGQNQINVKFLNEFLRDDGDVVVVRFPYHTMADISFETTHTVNFPGKKVPSRVRCTGQNCPLCAKGVKLDTRFFVKAIAYLVDETSGSVAPVNVVWDRPAAFADIEIKNLIQEYGDISNSLFKIKRNGTGTNTRYTISIITNTAVYKPEVYKADFSEINDVDASRILTKSMEQYISATNPQESMNEQQVKTEAHQPVPQPNIQNNFDSELKDLKESVPVSASNSYSIPNSVPNDDQRASKRFRF